MNISAPRARSTDIPTSLTCCLLLFIIERLRNAGTGKKVNTSSENSPTDTTRSAYDLQRNSERFSTSSSPPASPLTCSQLMNVKVEIEMKNLWDDFYSLGTEMIVTKAGRLVSNSLVLLCLTYSNFAFFWEIYDYPENVQLHYTYLKVNKCKYKKQSAHFKFLNAFLMYYYEISFFTPSWNILKSLDVT